MTGPTGKPASPQAFLQLVGKYSKHVQYLKGHIVFGMGDPADSVFYIQKGSIKLSVVSPQGREAVLAVLGSEDFFGEGCIAGQPIRLMTATVLSASTLVRINKQNIVRQLHRNEPLAWALIIDLIGSKRKVQDDLIDQLFNSTEKRLARALLLLAHYGTEGKNDGVIPKISQALLADMIGTSRPRVSSFMNKFRRLRFIEYNGGLKINGTLLSVVLHD